MDQIYIWIAHSFMDKTYIFSTIAINVIKNVYVMSVVQLTDLCSYAIINSFQQHRTIKEIFIKFK